jgi:hypothetical protein
MAIRTNISSATTTTLTPKAKGKGSIHSIYISNNSTNDATVSVYVDDDTNQYYFIKNLTVPNATAVVLDESIPFDSEIYVLKITNTGTSPNLTVILK